MPRHAWKARTGTDRTSFYDDVTRKIIAELEVGRVPWVQPWGTAAAKARFTIPYNIASRRRYNGINVLILWGAVVERGFSGQSWLTFRQALSLGGCVRKGERGTSVVYADRFVPAEELKRATRLGEEAQALPFLKRFTVFNTDQCDGLPSEISSNTPPPCVVEPQVEALIRATRIDFRIGGNRAFYCPSEDYVRVPPPAAYFDPINWHRTALHELAHASGHSSRLNRDMSGAYGTKKYAFEEIIAEISAAFCCGSLWILPTVRHADYIGSWLEVLREDNRAIVRAASQASRAANFLLGFLPDLAAGSTTSAADQDGRDVDPLLEEGVRGQAGFCDEPKAERGLRSPVTEI
jgi:antirestriction protein ArdC